MGNPDNSRYGEGDYKHDCERPMTGCDFPHCSCDVDEDDTSHKEEQENRDYDDIDVEDYTK